MQPALRHFFDGIRRRLETARDRLRSFRKHPPSEEASHAAERKLILRVKRPHALPSLHQLRYLPRVLKRWERVALFAATAVFAVSIIIFLEQITAPLRTTVARAGGTYTEALIGQPKFVNPLWSDANDVDRDLVRLVFSGLMRSNATGVIEPDLAQTVQVSEDGKTYTVTLKPNLFWHDGEPLTAHDVTFTIQTIQNPAYASVRAADFEGVTATASDDTTVTVTLAAPRASFPHALTVGILPAHLWSDVPPETARLAELNIKPIGNGPFRFKALKKTRGGAVHSLTLNRVRSQSRPTPYLEELIFRFYPDYRTAVEAVRQGNVDGVAFVPRELQPDLTRARHLVYYQLDLPQITALFFNQRQNVLLSEKGVREALARAIDKQLLVTDAFGGAAKIVNGPLVPGSFGFTDDLPRYELDLAAAGELLDSAGFRLAEGATVRTFVPRDRNDKRYVRDTELHAGLVTANVPDYVRAAEIIRDAWQSIGVNVEVTTVDPAALDRDVIAKRGYDILLYGELLGADPDPFPFWHSSQINSPGVNLAGYTNRRVDALLEEARALQDAGERMRRYEEFQKIVTTDLPAIFLLSPSYTYIIDRRIRGVNISPIGSPADRFAGIADWYVKTRTKWW